MHTVHGRTVPWIQVSPRKIKETKTVQSPVAILQEELSERRACTSVKLHRYRYQVPTYDEVRDSEVDSHQPLVVAALTSADRTGEELTMNSFEREPPPVSVISSISTHRACGRALRLRAT